MGAKIGPIHDDSLYAVRSRDLIQRVTGIRPEPASGDVFLRDAGFQSIQRLVLAEVNGGLVAGLFPGELKSTALFIYSDHRADAFVDAAQEGGWLVRGTPHIGFWQAPPRQRLYLDPRIDLEQYVALWEGPGYERIGGYSQEELERSVWPWLEEQGWRLQRMVPSSGSSWCASPNSSGKRTCAPGSMRNASGHARR